MTINDLLLILFCIFACILSFGGVSKLTTIFCCVGMACIMYIGSKILSDNDTKKTAQHIETDSTPLYSEHSLQSLRYIYVKEIFLPVLKNIDLLIPDYTKMISTNDVGLWDNTLASFIKNNINEDECRILDTHYMCKIANDYTDDTNKSFYLSNFIKRQPDLQLILELVYPYNDVKYNNIKKMITDIVEFVANDTQIKTVKNPTDTLVSYEEQVANKLKELGFEVDTTVKFTEQGTDIIAKKNNKKFAIRCKLHSLCIVGDEAVKEAKKACEYYKCDYSVVVANAMYSLSARKAAVANNVKILYDDQLDNLLKYVPETEKININDIIDDIPFK